MNAQLLRVSTQYLIDNITTAHAATFYRPQKIATMTFVIPDQQHQVIMQHQSLHFLCLIACQLFHVERTPKRVSSLPSTRVNALNLVAFM